MNQSGPSVVPQTNSRKGQVIFRSGDIVNSQVIIGDNNISINGDGNTIVNKVVSNQRPKITRVPSPVIVGRPSHPIFLLDREGEKKAASSTLRSGTPLQFFCPSGFGKSTLLRFLSSQTQLLDGMIFIEMRNQMTLDDLLQELFEAFYKSNRVYIPKQVEYKGYFEKLSALILLDDVGLTKEELQTLRYALPNCVFMMASITPQMLGQGNVVELDGLPLKHSVALFQQQIGRELTEKELPHAQKICETLHGHPLYIIEVAGAVRFDGNFLDAVAQRIQSQSPQEAVFQQSLRAIPDSEKRLLSILAVLGTAPLPAELMAEMLQTKVLAPLVKDLLERGLIKAHSPRYSLTGSLDVYLNKAWNLSPWRESVLRYFVDWSIRPLPSEKILDASEALFKVLEDAAGVNRWQEVLQIGQAVEPAFVLGGRWGAWSRLLRLVLRASQALGERAIEAWALHQIGSRALCLGRFQEAGEFLSRSLEIRKAIGDRSGISATQHNLAQLPGGTPPPRKPPSRGGPTSGKGWIVPVMGLVIATIAILVPILSSKDMPHFPVSVANTPTFTPTFTPTVIPTKTFTPLPTSSSTVTPSQTPSHTPTITPSPTSTPTERPTNTVTPSNTPFIQSLDVAVKFSSLPDRIMLYQGVDQDFFQVPVLIIVDNTGDVGISDFNFTIRYEAYDGSHSTVLRLDNQSVYQGAENVSWISSGQALSFETKVTVPKAYQGTQISLVAEVDRCQQDVQCQTYKTQFQLPKVVYDFVDSADQAVWVGYNPYYHSLDFNGSVDGLGSARLDSGLVLEDGTQPFYVLATHPTWVDYGRISGTYSPSVSFETNDLLVARMGFVGGGGGDGVIFSVYCNEPIYGSIPSQLVSFRVNPLQRGRGVPFFSADDKNDGILRDVVIPLPEAVIDGYCDSYSLWVDSGATSAQDWAVWVSAYIERP